jgi:hypothetical protein
MSKPRYSQLQQSYSSLLALILESKRVESYQKPKKLLPVKFRSLSGVGIRSRFVQRLKLFSSWPSSFTDHDLNVVGTRGLHLSELMVELVVSKQMLLQGFEFGLAAA